MKLLTLALLGLGAIFLVKKSNAATQPNALSQSALTFPIVNIGNEPGVQVMGSEGVFGEQIVSQGVVKDPYGRIFETAFPLIYLGGDVYTSVEKILSNTTGYEVGGVAPNQAQAQAYVGMI